MSSKLNPFSEGDFVNFKDDEAGFAWKVLEIHRNMCFIGDVGEEVSNVVQQWVKADELELWEPDEEDDQDFDDDDVESFHDWDELAST